MDGLGLVLARPDSSSPPSVPPFPPSSPRQLANLQQDGGSGKTTSGAKAAQSVNTQSIFRDVIKVEGYRGLMKGFAPSLVLHAMFLAGYFVVYEGSKRAMLSTSDTLSKRPFIAHILGGALAGSVVAGVTTPMDVSMCHRFSHKL